MKSIEQSVKYIATDKAYLDIAHPGSNGTNGTTVLQTAIETQQTLDLSKEEIERKLAYYEYFRKEYRLPERIWFEPHPKVAERFSFLYKLADLNADVLMSGHIPLTENQAVEFFGQFQGKYTANSRIEYLQEHGYLKKLEQPKLLKRNNI